MKHGVLGKRGHLPKWCLILAVLFFGVFLQSDARAFTFTLNVVDQGGNPLSGIRYLVEEDTTFFVDPSAAVQTDPKTGNIVNVKLTNHKSYAPVVTKGTVTGSSVDITVPDGKRYVVSVLPDLKHSLGGAGIGPEHAGQTVNVVCQANPLPTGQISVLVFHDNTPLNNAPDITEQGLANFAIEIFDQFGQQTTDAFGNILGSTYQQNPDGSFILDADGNPIVDTPGSGIVSDAAGKALVKYLAPGKYGVRAVPRDGQPWSQTATIEGTPGVDVWIKANEPPYLVEFGAIFHHVFIGFILPTDDLAGLPAPAASGSITGQVVNVHQSRPPSVALHKGPRVPEAWVGLNTAAGVAVYAQPCKANGSFQIDGVPSGSYQLVIWDKPLDQIVYFQSVVVPEAGGPVVLGKIPINAWFGRLQGTVFLDANENGFRDLGEEGIPDQAINLRFRDGSMYVSTATNGNGDYELLEVFPWFKWIVAEVDFLRYKATGATIVIDDGGAIPPDSGWDMPSEGKRNPQRQTALNPNTDNNFSRTETGPVLLEGMILYADQNHRIDWGKNTYAVGDNGGISGIVFYDTTRAENDPRYCVGDGWQPGIPRVQVNLYKDFDGNGVINDRDGDGQVTLADVDNYPFGWKGNPAKKGPEDIDRNGDGAFYQGDAVQIVRTDSWDDNMPTDCLGPAQTVDVGGVTYPIDSCAETLRTWNQVRPAVFDGGYAFSGLVSGIFIVEVVPPPGYEIVKEEDKNVDFGETYKPSPLLLPPVCVGDNHLVPDFLTLFPDEQIPAPFAGQMRPLCDRKQIEVVSGKNSAADVFIHTEVPKSGLIIGLCTNDLANTFNPDDPNAAEKLSPSFVPISIKDYQGIEMVRVYSDQFGGYNARVPSTFTANTPNPTGLSLNMVTICLNDPGPDFAHPDPNYNPAYGVVCYNMNVFPARITYADTPILPIAAFTASTVGQTDCEFPDGTPRLASVSSDLAISGGGPYVAAAGTLEVITIKSIGSVQVPNPDFDSTQPIGPGNPRTIARNFGFGAAQGDGSVRVGGTNLAILSWGDLEITARVPGGVTTGQLTVTRGNGLSTVTGITFTVGGPAPIHVGPLGSIQTAIDNAAPGSLILVAPGIHNENVIMWRNVKLQGWGEGSTVINAMNFTPEKEAVWLAKITNPVSGNGLVEQNLVDLVPGQRADFLLERGAAVTVLAKEGAFTAGNKARIDGFTITGAVHGGGIFVNGYAHYLEISNNRVASNQGNFGGGIRLGWPSLVNLAGDGYNSSLNDHIAIRHNHIKQNGSNDDGGGVAIFNGADNYDLDSNEICGNFSSDDGGGVAHFGKSHQGMMQKNKIFLNEVFKDLNTGGRGGGILVAGEAPPGGAPAGTLSPGTGSVTIRENLIQSNLASNDGGGISAWRVNGQDVQNNPGNSNLWHNLQIFNDMVVNNATQYTGGGIALNDAARVNISNCTVSHNDSAATNQETFRTGGARTNPQVAGIASRAHSAELAAALGGAQTFSNPTLVNSIIHRNRSFYWDSAANGGLGGLLPRPGSLYKDLGVVGTAGQLSPQYCILSGTTIPTNFAALPRFVTEFFNTIEAAGAGGEGMNSVKVLFHPLTLTGDYHIQGISPAIDAGTNVAINTDFDGEGRPNEGQFDIGADEFYP